MFDACICYEVDERVTLLSRTRPKARIPHVCGECGIEIQPGECYERDATVYEGLFAAYITCIPCVRVRTSMLTCDWYYGALWADIHAAYCDEELCICPSQDAPGTKPG
jgi:hypothetical protein